MPLYRLWRAAKDETKEAEAANDAAAVAVFEHMLGVPLTLEDTGAVAEYMMAVVPKEPHWSKRPDIPVWHRR